MHTHSHRSDDTLEHPAVFLSNPLQPFCTLFSLINHRYTDQFPSAPAGLPGRVNTRASCFIHQ